VKSSELFLAIDTSGAEAGVVLGGGGRTDTFFLETGATGAARTEDLPAVTARLLSARGAEPAALAFVAAVVGPGSYTGLRSGLAFLRGIAFTDTLPAVAVGTLELLVWRGARAGERVTAVCDGGSGRLVAGGYEHTGDDVRETDQPRIVEVPDRKAFLAAEAARGTVVVGAKLADSESAAALRACTGNPLEQLAALVESRWQGARTMRVSDLLPIYVGQAAARPNRHRVAVLDAPE
jgi:tRNA threonylcarbamoyladenosine biosynthesis protein TsaB